ncbi:thiopeptide-type bacteriocin biosynthesis protein [Dactylosporangium sp. McL0621]|uniref:thiopeptide-type bacteriocin biosynthesis protein n=1 Tax=Dactylosporangium sp. McL0621 TaxID=3415678 RepID=UPI003CF8E006
MNDPAWRQLNIRYPGSTAAEREQHAIAHLGRVLPAAEAAGLITTWSYIRKDAWRVRYLPAGHGTGPDLAERLLTDDVAWNRDIYEPEAHAFGGDESMAAAHLLFHRDSRQLLDYLALPSIDRRERSLILCTQLMRAAGLDINEQGDVWAKVLEHRAEYGDQPATVDPTIWAQFTSDTRSLLLGAPRTRNAWHTAFTDAGTTLRDLRETGRLTRGIRAIIALHVIFHWNRLGLDARAQATQARAARDAVFGEAPPSYRASAP